ncbi:nucleoside-diphosphate kinase [candidate division WOR-3 bacterium]|nr:nucleoside-diphosphate kinase [candidate division WOR-3 bacterium]
MEQTLLLIKPDAIERNLIGKVISRVEEAGLKILDMKMVLFTRKMTEHFYGEHKGKEFYNRLIEYMADKKVVALKLEGENAVKTLRDLVGATDPKKAEKNTIRADFGVGTPQNSVHASDSFKSAIREIKFFFGD